MRIEGHISMNLACRENYEKSKVINPNLPEDESLIIDYVYYTELKVKNLQLQNLYINTYINQESENL
jgi:hypothetical protein